MIEQKLLDNLKGYLIENINKLSGEFVKKNNGYDAMICHILSEFQVNTSRYWDAVWVKKELHIEFKKGKSIWLDLVRYSEQKLGINNEAKIDSITLFFIPDRNKDHIEKIVGMKTENILNKLNLNDDEAKFIINLNNKVPRSLNAQASLTVNDIMGISDFIVER